MEIVTDKDKSFVIDPSKLRGERERCREEIRQEEVSNFKFVTGLYFERQKRCNPGYSRRTKWKKCADPPNLKNTMYW